MAVARGTTFAILLGFIALGQAWGQTPTVKCSFESGLCGYFHNVKDVNWGKTPRDEFDWTRKTGSTPSGGTGPSAAADGKAYMFIEASWPRKSGDKARLESSPMLAAKGDYFNFEYHMKGKNIDCLKVFFGPMQVWSRCQQQGSHWKKATVSLDAFAGQTDTITIQGSRGSGWAGDIAIDNFEFFAGSSPSTTAGWVPPIGSGPSTTAGWVPPAVGGPSTTAGWVPPIGSGPSTTAGWVPPIGSGPSTTAGWVPPAVGGPPTPPMTPPTGSPHDAIKKLSQEMSIGLQNMTNKLSGVESSMGKKLHSLETQLDTILRSLGGVSR